jgi:hypothetical protein
MVYEITTWRRTKRRAAMQLRCLANRSDPSAAACARMQYAAYEMLKRELHSAWVALDQKAEIIGSLQSQIAIGGHVDV